ncbi:MAG: hypothetical protein H6626_09345 [Pseudobdellovibrionaceae bacterium]|nr:hypothetical protein [Bdellovibrionales bacterium]USN46420.1 MAG: hypothetical protein H6626_09345 [Pseudobdellovibrionaceae bacterium]
MRVIRLHEISSFVACLVLAALIGWGFVDLLGHVVQFEKHQDIFDGVAFLLSSFAVLMVIYKLLVIFAPIPKGELGHSVGHSWRYHIHTLFYLMVFQPLLISGIMPIPMRRGYFQLMGAKLGENVYPAGVLLDPLFIEIGDFCVVGFKSLICPHVHVGGVITHLPIKIGRRVTIAVGATIYGGTIIEDDARVLPHAVVNPNTHIKKGEVWGGIPARRIMPRHHEKSA